MKNSFIVEYEADNNLEFITNIFNSTKEMAGILQTSCANCQSIISRKSKHKGYKYERIWLNR